jgi:hypothetical protein
MDFGLQYAGSSPNPLKLGDLAAGSLITTTFAEEQVANADWLLFPQLNRLLHPVPWLFRGCLLTVRGCRSNWQFNRLKRVIFRRRFPIVICILYVVFTHHISLLRPPLLPLPPLALELEWLQAHCRLPRNRSQTTVVGDFAEIA